MAIKSNLLLSAISIRAIDLSAVFIVPIIYKLSGTANNSLDGKVTIVSFSLPILLSSYIKVISSPNILDILPLLISSMIIT